MSNSGSLTGLRVVAFESRRANEISEMIRRHGGDAISAPALREAPLSENSHALEFGRRLRGKEIDIVVLLTGVGTRFLVDALSAEIPKEDFARALASVITVARGPKPGTALRELGLTPSISVPEPNTWKELLAAMDERLDIHGKRVAVQEYGEENPELLAGLRERGADVLQVPVYRWAFPDDVEPLKRAIRQILEGQIHVVVFTSAIQVEHMFQAAGKDVAEPLRESFSRLVAASIGPTCSEAMRRHGLAVDIEPEHPKLGSLINALVDSGPALVHIKRQAAR